MVSEPPWRSEAILRLMLSVFVAHFLGAVGIAAYRFAGDGDPAKLGTFVALAAGAGGFGLGALVVLWRPWQLDRFTRRFATLLGCLYLCLMLGAFAQQTAGGATLVNPAWRTIIAAISFQGLALVFIGRFLREHQMGWRRAFGFRQARGRAILYGVLLACAFLPVGWLLQAGTAELLTRFDLGSDVQPAVEALKHTTQWFDRAAMGLAALVLAPLAEEMIFRGILYPAVRDAGFPRLAWWGVALLFAGVHAHLATFLPLFLFAMLLTWLYVKTRNLLAPIAAHAMFNALNFGVFYLTQGEFL